MRHFASTVVITVCIFSLVWPVRGFAQATPRVANPPAAYEGAVDLAFQEFEAGNYAEARARFLQAYELFPNARVLRALGKTEYELKNYVAAISFLEQALASTVRPLTAPQRADTEQLLTQSRGYVARYTILTVPEQTSVRLDGVDTPLSADSALLLSVGEHVIEVQATGYQPARRVVQVLGKADEVIRIDLSPLAPAAISVVEQQPGPLASAPPPMEKPTPLRKKWWVWTGVAFVVAGGVATTIVLSRREPETEQASGGTTRKRIPVSP